MSGVFVIVGVNIFKPIVITTQWHIHSQLKHDVRAHGKIFIVDSRL